VKALTDQEIGRRPQVGSCQHHAMPAIFFGGS
jgi:hypothetical protein